MKKQTILVGLLTAAFVLVTAGASFAGDRRLHKPRKSHWKGHHFAAKHNNGHWKTGHRVRAPKAHWKGRHQVPRQKWHHRGTHQRPGYRAHNNPSRRGWGPKQSYHHRPGQYGHRPEMRRNNDHYPSGASFRRQHDGRSDRGHVSDRPAMQRGDRHAGRDNDTAYASDDAPSNRGNRDGSGRQRQR
jgi:hypothetical protein